MQIKKKCLYLRVLNIKQYIDKYILKADRTQYHVIGNVLKEAMRDAYMEGYNDRGKNKDPHSSLNEFIQAIDYKPTEHFVNKKIKVDWNYLM